MISLFHIWIVVVKSDDDEATFWSSLWNPWGQATLMCGYILNTKEGRRYLD